jgi:hypothetical protein
MSNKRLFNELLLLKYWIVCLLADKHHFYNYIESQN